LAQEDSGLLRPSMHKRTKVVVISVTWSRSTNRSPCFVFTTIPSKRSSSGTCKTCSTIPNWASVELSTAAPTGRASYETGRPSSIGPPSGRSGTLPSKPDQQLGKGTLERYMATLDRASIGSPTAPLLLDRYRGRCSFFDRHWGPLLHLHCRTTL